MILLFQPICIPSPDDDLDEIAPAPSFTSKPKYGLAFGWGTLNADKLVPSNALMEVGNFSGNYVGLYVIYKPLACLLLNQCQRGPVCV